MDQYPKPVPPPSHVHLQREARHRRLVKSTTFGVFVRVFIIIGELIGYTLFNSSALLLDALSTIVDVASTLFLVACFTWAYKPPDKEHPFGHGRFEPIGGLQLSLLLAGIGVFMLIQQVLKLATGMESHDIDPRAWIIPLVAIVLLEWCYQVLNKTAKKEMSPALQADALHYRMDAINSLFAFLALVLAAFYPNWGAVFDHLGAMAIAFLMIVLGCLAARDNLRQLVDRVPDDSFFERVRKAAKRVPGVLETEKIRIQRYGPDAHVDIDIEVAPNDPVWKAHEISQQVRAEIQRDWPAVQDVTVHIEPFYPNDH